MKTHVIKSLLIIGFSLSATLLASATASASGSMPSARPPVAGNQTSTENNSYDLGKTIYMEKISCSSCPVANGVNDAASAKALLMRVDANEFKLSRSEKRRLKTFLNRRFELN